MNYCVLKIYVKVVHSLKKFFSYPKNKRGLVRLINISPFFLIYGFVYHVNVSLK